MFEIVVGEGGAPLRCPVCRSARVALDAVERGPQVWLELAECGHCDHRWTRPEPPRPARGVLRAPGRHADGEAVRAA